MLTDLITVDIGCDRSIRKAMVVRQSSDEIAIFDLQLAIVAVFDEQIENCGDKLVIDPLILAFVIIILPILDEANQDRARVGYYIARNCERGMFHLIRIQGGEYK